MKAAIAALAVIAFCAISGQAAGTGRHLMQAPAEAPSAQAPTSECTTIPEVATGAGLTTLLQAVELAGLTSTLSNATAELTVFAPTNEAFEKALAALGIPGIDLNGLQQQNLLVPILENHVVEGALNTTELLEAKTLTTLDGQELTVGEGTLTTASGNSANLVMADVPACDSVVHVIDAVLVPQLTGLASGTK